MFAIVGGRGFMASPPPPDAPPLAMEHGHGMILGIPTNTSTSRITRPRTGAPDEF